MCLAVTFHAFHSSPPDPRREGTCLEIITVSDPFSAVPLILQLHNLEI
jgi:hypothetical protein